MIILPTVNRPTLNGGVECKENEKNRDFRPIYRFISKPIQDKAIFTMEGE